MLTMTVTAIIKAPDKKKLKKFSKKMVKCIKVNRRDFLKSSDKVPRISHIMNKNIRVYFHIEGAPNGKSKKVSKENKKKFKGEYHK